MQFIFNTLQTLKKFLRGKIFLKTNKFLICILSISNFKVKSNLIMSFPLKLTIILIFSFLTILILLPTLKCIGAYCQPDGEPCSANSFCCSGHCDNYGKGTFGGQKYGYCTTGAGDNCIPSSRSCKNDKECCSKMCEQYDSFKWCSRYRR